MKSVYQSHYSAITLQWSSERTSGPSFLCGLERFPSVWELFRSFLRFFSESWGQQWRVRSRHVSNKTSWKTLLEMLPGNNNRESQHTHTSYPSKHLLLSIFPKLVWIVASVFYSQSTGATSIVISCCFSSSASRFNRLCSENFHLLDFILFFHFWTTYSSVLNIT